jgi:lipopolysaccharide/colanic/teichoic acid biosynthesis glycosyltransferase
VFFALENRLLRRCGGGKQADMSPKLRQNSDTASGSPEEDLMNDPGQSQVLIALAAEPVTSFLYFCWYVGINLLFSVAGSLLLLVLLPAFALCIYLDSPGPIFYVQERLGYQGKPFGIYKFRSMRMDAEQNGEAVWATDGDERVTRVGHLLRKTHLDELPQVLNILQGDMALIGPRPERAAFAVQLEKLCPLYRHRLLVKPGLTGLAQVKYGYGADSTELRKLEFDLEYIQRRSIGLDLQILLKTIVEVFTLSGR